MRTIVLVGGNEFRADCVPMDEEVLRRAARAPARVLIVPTAAARERPDLAARNGIRFFSSLGAPADGLMAIERADWEKPDHLARLAEVDLVYLTGGDPWYLLATIRDTPLLAAILRRCDEGAILAGSSAGAMVLAAWMRQRAGGWAPALGVVPGVAVVPHDRPRVGVDRATLRAGLPDEITLLGIAEATGCVSGENNGWEVIGAGSVTVVGLKAEGEYRSGQGFALKPEPDSVG